MLGINGSEFIVLLVVAAVVLGPERLPHYAQQLARLIRELRNLATGAQEKVREELGPDFDDVDWRALDPRRYDPRRIVRDALADTVDLDDPLGIKDDPYGRKAAARSRPGRHPDHGLDGPDGPDGPGTRAAGGAGDHGPLFDPDAT